MAAKLTHAAPAGGPYTATLAQRSLAANRVPEEGCVGASDDETTRNHALFMASGASRHRGFSTLEAPQWQRGELPWCSGPMADGCW